MTRSELLSKVARAFGRAFIVGLLVYLPGLLSAPNLNQSYALGVAALAAAVSAGLTAIAVFVPLLTTGYEILDVGLRAAVGFFIVSLVGILNSPELNFGRSVVVALVAGALAAGVRAIQGAIVKNDQPVPTLGPPPPAARAAKKKRVR